VGLALLAAALFVACLPVFAVVPPPVQARHGMVVTAQHLATEVGVDVLKKGGNAVDAAVAVGYALAVVHPCCGNIGGGGFMLIHLKDGRNVFLDFREKAPMKASADMYLDKQGNVVPGLSTESWLSVGVPGTVMGLDTALKKYGTMTRRQVMQPAIELAEKGFVLTPGDVAIMGEETRKLGAHPNVAAIFLDHGKPFEAGHRFVQPQLARTLERIEKEGSSAFYRGPIADALAEASKANGGILTKADLAAYTVEEQTPVTGSYRGCTIVSSPPPSSGGTTICEILNVLSGYPMAKLGFHSAEGVHLMAEAMRYAYADRNTYLGDPDFVKNPLKELLSAKHAAWIRSQIKPERAGSAVRRPRPPSEGADTTHYSIVDGWGNAVAVTYTLNAWFGCGRMAGDTGFFLNDEMDDFTSKPGVPNMYGLVQGKANAIEPDKRPLSSMAPTMVFRDGRLVMVTGSPGGSRIITITLESILNVIDHGMNVRQAVDAPRIHFQGLPDVLYAEPRALSPDTAALLKKMGYTIEVQDPWGACEAIAVDPKTGVLYGANDDRRPAGLAMGY
jgi:gamma-glutamyltranspeptidase/glutathione hydrolase